jgi:hypothetical protein
MMQARKSSLRKAGKEERGASKKQPFQRRVIHLDFKSRVNPIY